MRSSKAAVDLIVTSEVSSRAYYDKVLRRPEWPQGQSGITIGIGYDCGYATRERIADDWGRHLPASMISALQRCAGVKGGDAQHLLASVKNQVSVPWEAANDVFMNRDMPKWEAIVLKAVPGSEKLPAGCFGVLTSLAYNRGASFSLAGDRYREMRAIRTHVVSGEWDEVPEDIRSMKRLWPKDNQRGLRIRRDAEAKLWEQSLAAQANPITDISSSNRISTGDERKEDVPDVVTPEGNDEAPLNVQPSHAAYNVEVETIQRALISLGYHEVGDVDGKAGGKFVAGVAAFMTDRGKDPNKGKITQDLRNEISTAKGESWTRPIAPERANATAKDIAPKVASVNQTWWQKVWGCFLGIPAAAATLFKSVFGDSNDPSSYIYSVKSFFSSIPSEYYFGLVAIIAAIIVVQAVRSQNATVKSYQRGEIN